MPDPLIFLTAGEPSGDLLGARLMAAAKQRTGGRIRFAGIGGPRMTAEGLDSLFPMEELSVFGAAEILPKARQLLGRVRQTAERMLALSPAAAVTIDAPAFNFRVGKRLAGRSFPLIHYVAPQVWAWRPGRARVIARFLDHLIVLLPFEPAYFQREGLPCTFVGHPILESGADHGDGPGFRQRHGIPAESRLLAILPGSRRSEITRLLDGFGATAALLAADRPDLQVAVPTVGATHARVAEAVRAWPVPVHLVEGDREKYDAFAAADAALAASGTVTLELAMAGVPMVVGYRLNPMTYAYAKALVSVRHINMVNILLDRRLVPEYVQRECVPANLAPAIGRLLDDRPAAAAMSAELRRAVGLLGVPGARPSDRAAELVLRLAGIITAQEEAG